MPLLTLTLATAQPATATPGEASSGEAGIGVVSGLFDLVAPWLPFVIILAVVIGALRLADLVLLGKLPGSKSLTLEQRLPRQITMLVLTIFAIVAGVLALPSGPVSDSTRGDLLGLIGLGVTAVLTLSSTTLAANGMSGIMLRATARFKGGDWVRVGEHVGRVTERGLFHTEIQTEDRDLMSLPNLYLATNPVRIVQAKGTVVSATVSLGYDVPHQRVEGLLLQAATDSGLEDPFVWVTELLDHAVNYRVAGTLTDVTGLISQRSKLRVRMLDALHGAKIEIASPGIMIQRRGSLEDIAIPSYMPPAKPKPIDDEPVEQRVFDKAESAARKEALETERVALEARLDTLKSERKQADESERAAIEREELSVGHELAQIEQEIEDEAAEDEEKK